VQHANSIRAHGLQQLGLFLGGVLLASALLSPPLCWAAQALLHVLHIDASQQLAWPLNEIVKADFERYFGRCVLVCAVVGLIIMVRRAKNEGAVLPSLKPSRERWFQLVLGFALASGLLLALGWFYCHSGVYVLRNPAPWTSFTQPITAALGAGIVEELLFRGAILGIMLRSMSTRAAMFVTTFFFAIVHFMKPPDAFTIPVDQVTWLSGFQVVGSIFGRFGDARFLLAEFFALFAVGYVLAWARMRTGSLWASAGLHAGWVFGLKYFSALTVGSKALRHGDYLPWIGENLKIGLTPLIVIVVTGFVMSFCLPASTRAVVLKN
jgi:hypothetical protein